MPKISTKIGDVFSAKLDDTTKKYFQYIANDLTQLNSDVIRVFKKVYLINATPVLSEVVNGDIDFYAHCVTKFGIKQNLWERVGNIADIGKVDILFRDTNDYGSKPGMQVKKSYNWYVWKINEEFKNVGKLEGEFQKAEIGVVFPPFCIIHRMKTGKYNFEYPEY